MTESEAIMIIDNKKPSCGEKIIFAEGDRCEAIEMAINALEGIQKYRTIGTVEECRAAVEMQTAIPRELIEGKYFCPKCHNLMPYPGYCGCGQKVY
ncbi:hypothetical protein [Roseburia inulinivorans]|jgi:hypothetical protein